VDTISPISSLQNLHTSIDGFLEISVSTSAENGFDISR
jgi:hypothetical protein